MYFRLVKVQTMSFISPTYNVIAQPIGLEFKESVNKILYDQTVVAPVVRSYADFYALMPSDNAVAIAVGADVAFPQNGPSSNSDVIRVSASTSSFTLVSIGTYHICFSVPVSIAGQLVVTLNGVELPQGVFGRAALTSPIGGSLILTTVTANSVITIRNPAGNTAALPITASAGGASAVSSHLVVTRLY